MVPSLFQDATCSDLVFSRVLCFFEISTCNHPCFQEYGVNSPFQLQIPFIKWPSLQTLHVYSTLKPRFNVGYTWSVSRAFSIIKEQL